MELESYTQTLDELTGKQITIYLYENVQDIENVHAKVVNKELPCCIIKANVIVDPFQLVIAANKAALNEKYGQMVTRSIFTEVIYSLSISKNISQALKDFGISSDHKTNNYLVVLVHTAEDLEELNKLVVNCIKGERKPISQLSELANLKLIKKLYKVDDRELKVSNLIDSIVSKISEKK
ncbi:hypothetical protein TKK_0006118 [Trichogramma kaykai]|uniref:Uncharacterized protein n=1 Tax=Trichogramma kaykai TaxID=54128 RepID=A0ABD2XEF1_9HYME